MSPFGNLVVNLLLLFLSLGSFKIALDGIFSGVAEGAKSATFPLATKPFGFLLITVFWLSLGLFMLYVCWRGMAQSKEPDEIDSARDEHLNTVPQPLPLEELEPRLRAQPESPTSDKTPFDQFLQRAKAPSAAYRVSVPIRRSLQPSHDAAPHRQKSSSVALPDALHIYASRSTASFWIIFVTLFIVACGYLALSLSAVLGQGLALMLFSIACFVYLVAMVKLVRLWLWEGPALSLEKYGITDHYGRRDQIPWTDLKGVQFDRARGTSLALQFEHLSQTRAHFGLLSLPFALAKRIFYNGYEGVIPLSCLSYDGIQVLAVANAFLRHSKRQTAASD